MSTRKEILGFNDLKLSLVVIPILGITFPLLFFGESIPNWLNYWYFNIPFGCLFSSIVWFGNVQILIFFRKKFNNPNAVIKRLIRQIPLNIIFTVIISTVLISIEFFLHNKGISLEEPIRTCAGALTFLAVSLALYEGIYFFNQYRKSIVEKEKLQKENIQSQLSTLKNQVSPHFLFNSLNTLIELIHENQDMAVEYAQQLSNVYRRIVEIKDEELINIEDELDCIKASTFLLSKRFEDNLNIELRIDEKHYKDKIVPLSIQMLLENAIKHNVISSEKPLHIVVETNDKNKLLVKNNLQRKKQVLASTKTGLLNIKNRYLFLANKSIDVIVTQDHFIVSLPILKASEYAHINS